MSAFLEETVLSVHHWTDRLFSFTTTRDPTLRFSNGHFTMIGLRLETGKPLLRAYSIVSPNYEEYLEFLSIKVPDGPTSRLQNIKVGDTILMGRKLHQDLSLPELNPTEDRVMICGSPGMLGDVKIILGQRGFREGNTTTPGDFVIERAFA